MNPPLKIVFLTPGTGGWYCGACMRDNALAKALHAAGHEVSLLPMYLPLQLDEEPLSNKLATPVFFGGINVYLQQKFPWFRHSPRWIDDWLNRPQLLRKVARRSHMTSARDHGAMTLAMLRMEGRQFDKELAKLTDWLAADPPEILCLSTALQAGMIRRLRKLLPATRIIACFQGEDGFLDGLPAPFRDACWQELALRVREADRLISPTRYYAEWMQQRLGSAHLHIDVLPNGINLTGYEARPDKSGPPVIGYLARMNHGKGLEVMIDAFIHLRIVLGHPDARLDIAGAATPADEPGIAALRRKLAECQLAGSVRWLPNISRAEKASMLAGLSLFTVPARDPEAFGLYVVEAMACGVPVVQPAVASFRELLGANGAGCLVEAAPGEWPQALARAWHELLGRPGELAAMGRHGRRAAETSYAVEHMAARFAELARGLLEKTPSAGAYFDTTGSPA